MARRSTRGSGRRTRPAGAATRERILTAALAIFSERGFDGTTTRDLAARAGANLGLIKYYFGTKERLWKAAIDRAYGELGGALAVALSAEVTTAEQLAEVVRVCVRFAARHPELVRIMNDEGKRDGPRMRWLADRHGRPLFEALRTVTDRAQAQGLLPAVPAAHLYYILIGGVGMIFSQAPECRRITGVDPSGADAVVEAHADALVRLLVPTA